jgi:Peptidase_C39 like family
MPRRRTIAIAVLAALVAAAPFFPNSSGPDRALRSSGGTKPAPAPSTSDATGAVTSAMQAEIDRVVAEGLAQPAFRGKPGPAALIGSQLRCATFEQLTYCLHLGWTDESQADVQQRALAVAAKTTTSTTSTETTGDLDLIGTLSRAAAAPPQDRADAERTELTQAAASVAKVWTIRNEILGIPLPAGFAARHPEALGLQARAKASGSASASASPSASASASPSTSPTPKPKTAADYPQRDKVLKADQTAEQTRSYWCGPTSMQMIAWGWYDRDGGQDRWSNRLGTTSNGTDITSIVRVINDATGWDRKAYAGPYVTLDIKKFTYRQWYLLMMRHIHDYQAPVVLHPILHKAYFPYLDDDASGHYQVGRGYNQRGDKPNLLGYFEPWNQQRFDPSEPFIERVQWRNAYKSFRANKDHPFHNVGV